jgi:hypothetical protein
VADNPTLPERLLWNRQAARRERSEEEQRQFQVEFDGRLRAIGQWLHGSGGKSFVAGDGPKISEALRELALETDTLSPAESVSRLEQIERLARTLPDSNYYLEGAFEGLVLAGIGGAFLPEGGPDDEQIKAFRCHLERIRNRLIDRPKTSREPPGLLPIGATYQPALLANAIQILAEVIPKMGRSSKTRADCWLILLELADKHIRDDPGLANYEGRARLYLEALLALAKPLSSMPIEAGKLEQLLKANAAPFQPAEPTVVQAMLRSIEAARPRRIQVLAARLRARRSVR